MTRKPSLMTISYNEKACREINHHIKSIIGESIEVTSYYYTQIRPDVKIRDDLVLITTPLIQDEIIPKLEEGCPYLVARRSIDYSNIGQLLLIPRGSRVLVVNNLFENAVEAINELREAGIKDYSFVPHHPDRPLQESFEYAVTFNEREMVPQGIPRLVDLGSRLISITTIAEILLLLTGSSDCENLVASRYLAGVVKNSVEIFNRSRRIEELTKYLQMVMSSVEEGLLVADENCRVLFYNEAAKNILDVSAPVDFLAEALRQFVGDTTTGFTKAGEKTLHYSVKRTQVGEGQENFIINLRDITEIQNIDAQYRKQKKYGQFRAKYSFDNFLHASPLITNLIQKAKEMAATESTILITGESGTGKELFAQSIHNASPRKARPFIAVNCAALSENLLESELFGYEDGAFTGAKKGGKRGLFELAQSGTIFLDEIGDTSLNTQIKLLRVLQEKEIMRIGGAETLPVDVRVIAATNQDLRELVKRGEFRLDLFYRLNVLPLHIPPLRERVEDVEVLLNYYLSKYAVLQNKPKPHISSVILEMLDKHPWRGNVRELENIADFIVTIGASTHDLRQDLVQLLAGWRQEKKKTDAAGTGARGAIFSSPRLKQETTLLLLCLAKLDMGDVFIGKNVLRQELERQGLSLSDQQTRTRLRLLREAGFVDIQPGRGCLLTPLGRKEALVLEEEGRQGFRP